MLRTSLLKVVPAAISPALRQRLRRPRNSPFPPFSTRRNPRNYVNMARSKRLHSQLETVNLPSEIDLGQSRPSKLAKVARRSSAKVSEAIKEVLVEVGKPYRHPAMPESVRNSETVSKTQKAHSLPKPKREAKAKAATNMSAMSEREDDLVDQQQYLPESDAQSDFEAIPDPEVIELQELKRKPAKKKRSKPLDGEVRPETEARKAAVIAALARPPAVNSDYLPLPWKGRLGYACLNTYLRYSTPPVFSGRTCRIKTIEENQYPLKHPGLPEDSVKNARDKSVAPDIESGIRYAKQIGIANTRDIVPMMRWNEKYGIKFMRLSSEMFPYASHEKYGYRLAPFASKLLAEVGKVAASLGHRLTTHPGQFTQLASPRDSVIRGAIRDLTYHDEMLSLLKLPEQQNRDAVMILHMGGAFEDKAATLDRFRVNYATLSQTIKNRIVLENDDVNWSVHDLLPVCQELNIPLVLDFHHNNIVFDATEIREGTKDIMDLYPAITETWTRKGITQKMHYSEQTATAITKKDRVKHSARVATLPPCPDTMDLMIEAKDKEQAVFELMRKFKLNGWENIGNLIPHTRNDINPVAKRGKQAEEGRLMVPDREVGMGGKENSVYWPLGMAEWLEPVKNRRVKKESINDDGATRAGEVTRVESFDSVKPKKMKRSCKKLNTTADEVSGTTVAAENAQLEETTRQVKTEPIEAVTVKAKRSAPRKRKKKA